MWVERGGPKVEIMGFVETFTAVFTALILSKIAEEAYRRWLDDHVKKGFDKVEEKAKTAKDNFRF